jgi:elongation factor P--(R)-beta-lysine ligase
MRARLTSRARLLARVRAFFAERGVLEVETPVLSHATVTDVHLHSLQTRIAGFSEPFYLQTSPEYAMKRLLSAGSGDIYQIARVFRDEESGRHHNPEFTLLEWYRTGFDHERLMDEVEQLLGELLGPRLDSPAERLSYREAFRRILDLDPFAADDAAVLDTARRLVHVDLGDHEREAALDLLMGAIVGPALGVGRITFVTAYPANQAALARLIPGSSPPVAARFEAYVAGIELCNGFHELSDAAEQRRRFVADRAARRARGLPEPPIDERLLAALEAGIPDCAGVALGLDRVLMLAEGASDLAEVLAFPIHEA